MSKEMKTEIKMVGSKVLCKMMPKETQKGGIYIPESDRGENQRGQVVCYGPDCESVISTEYEVIVRGNAGTEVQLFENQEGTYKVFEEKEILAILY